MNVNLFKQIVNRKIDNNAKKKPTLCDEFMEFKNTHKMLQKDRHDSGCVMAVC
jgi:hypothetical protein